MRLVVRRGNSAELYSHATRDGSAAVGVGPTAGRRGPNGLLDLLAPSHGHAAPDRAVGRGRHGERGDRPPLRVDSDTGRRWWRCFARRGTTGFGVIAPGHGRKPWLPNGTMAAVVRVTQHDVPAGTTTHWSTRAMGQRFGISKDTGARIWGDHGLAPWRFDPFQLSADPYLEAKLVDVVGLALDPPERAAVFGVDEKTQYQALDRTQPGLPVVPVRAGTMAHDDQRRRTTDWVAALNSATDAVLTHCRRGHAAVDVRGFVKRLDGAVPRDLDVHVALDNRSAHQGPEIRAWLAQPRQQRWYQHRTIARRRRARG